MFSLISDTFKKQRLHKDTCITSMIWFFPLNIQGIQQDYLILGESLV